MTWRCANNARAMRAACGRQPANPEINFVVSWLAALAVSGFAAAITVAAIYVAGVR
jgi:hypothetical protein